MNPFNREAMLERMNREVLRLLHLERESFSDGHARVLDMGLRFGCTLPQLCTLLAASRFVWDYAGAVAVGAGVPAQPVVRGGGVDQAGAWRLRTHSV